MVYSNMLPEKSVHAFWIKSNISNIDKQKYITQMSSNDVDAKLKHKMHIIHLYF